MKQVYKVKLFTFTAAPQTILILRLIIALALMTISRLLLYFLNASLFPGLTSGKIFLFAFTGLRFDISAVLYANCVVIFMMLLPLKVQYEKWWQHTTNIIYCVSNTLALVPNFVDVIYYRFTMKRLTGDIFKYLTVGAESGLMAQFIRDFWFIFLFWIISIFILFRSVRRIRVSNSLPVQNRLWYYGGQTLLAVFFAGLTVLGMRGGFQLKPISILTANKYADPQDTPLVLNSAFSIMRTLEQNSIEKKSYFKSEEELNQVFNPIHNYSRTDSAGGILPMKRLNVVVIILESFSREHIGILNKGMEGGKYPGFTPFLDSLIGQSMIFDGFSNGKRSIEGIPAVLASIPTWMTQDYITSSYSGNHVNSLATLLKQEGYSTSFFHGGKNGTMGFDSFSKSAGFDQYFGRSEYNNDKDFDGEWGIWDEPFLQYFAGSLNTMPQPFLSAIFTLSSHHPYKVPEKYKGKFRKGHLPIQQAIMYSDFALQQFFKTAGKMPWFANTLFVFTADHTSEAYFPEYKTRVGQYRIPIFFYQAGSKLKGNSATTIQQTDIMPSILDYLGYSRPFFAFGNSAFDTGSSHFNLTAISNSYQLIQGNYSLQWSENTMPVLYDFSKDPLLARNISAAEPETSRRMEQLLKGVTQQYNNRMIENRLIIR